MALRLVGLNSIGLAVVKCLILVSGEEEGWAKILKKVVRV